MYKLISKISYAKRIKWVIITLSKLLSIKIKKHFFSILNEVKVYYKRKLEKRKKNQNATFLNSCRFPGIAGNTGNCGNNGKFHKSHQIFNQIKRNINKLCLGKISRQKAVICSMAKNENPEMPAIKRKLSKSKKHLVLTFYCY